jgi:hypothetical protein
VRLSAFFRQWGINRLLDLRVNSRVGILTFTSPHLYVWYFEKLTPGA